MGARPAFVDALALARKFGAALHMLHVEPTFGDDPVRNAFDAAVNADEFYKAMREEMDNRMQAIIEASDAENVDINRVHLRGKVASEVILDYAKSEHMDLIVMGTHGYRGLRRLVVGSVTADVARTACCDVLTVRNVTGVPASRDGFEHMLVPVDLSASSEYQLKEASEMARLYDVPVTILHVVEPFPLPTWAINSDMLNDLIPSRLTHAKEQLDAFVSQVLGAAAEQVNVVLEEGKPANTIVEYADKNKCDFIVMTPRGSEWASHLPLGSVAERVMASSNNPVYLVHLPDSEASETGSDQEAATV